MDVDYPSIQDFEANRALLGNLVIETPAHQWRDPALSSLCGPGTDIFLKLELLQFTGTFKPRGALTNLLRTPESEWKNGITAVSAGNHAIATAYAAKVMGTSAKVVMLSTASALRQQRCRAYGAEIILADDVHTAFDIVKEIEREEGRLFVHPFEGRNVALGTGTCGLEFARQVPDLDAMIIPIGGGGLCAGFSCAMKQLQPTIEVYGVEPEGADTMSRSFRSGKPEAIDKVRTIADSLGAPYATEYSFALCRRFVDDLVLISDDSMRAAMRLLLESMKLAVEPAGAAATAALIGPLKERLAGKRVGVLVCGSNISADDYTRLIASPA